jgi:3-phosphoshikimate 1-carboxyvinyltransferase
MIREIKPIEKIDARVRVPGSKSITNRALICAALAHGDSVIHNASDSDDTALMANGLNQLGVLVRKKDETLVVSGTGGRLFAPKFPVPVGNAGTTLRFLTSVAALAEGKTIFEGDMRMAERPVDDLLDALRQLGIQTQTFGTRYTIHGGGFRGGPVRLKADRSSQFVTSLLMVAPYATEDVQIEVDGTLSSIPFVDMTIDVMKKFGVSVQYFDGKWFTVKSGLRYSPATFSVEPDASGASYFFAAAAITGGEVTVEGLRKESLQGDVKFVEVLRQMGCDVTEEESGVRILASPAGRQSSGKLKGVDVDMNAMPDVVPTLAVTALFANGPTRIHNVAHLRYKESDRLTALATELRKLGASVTLMEDGLEIVPAPLHGAQLDTYDDHRLVMSFALAGLKVPGVKIENPECVKKSFPTFWREFEKLHINS